MTPAVDLSSRDQSILQLVSFTGVASARQLERWAFPDPESTPLSRARRCRRTLARLHAGGYLLRLERHLGGARAGSSGWLYQLSTKAKRHLGLPGRGRTWEPGARFVSHALAVTELHVRLAEAERRGECSGLQVEHEPAIWRRFATAASTETLKPDLLVELTDVTGWELRWFIEVDRGTEHLPTILAKCQTYERYWRSGAETRHHEVFPRVCWSVPDPPRAAAIAASIERTPTLTNDLYRIAVDTDTVGVITNQQKGGHP